MAQATNNSNKRSKGGWLTASLLFALALCPQVFAAPVSYTYDDLNRLTEANYSNGQQIVTYTYDAAGNILSKTIVVDTDTDGVPDDLDNCIEAANADQRDTDGDGYGNMCDGDLNNDGIVNSLDLGLFKLVYETSDPDADFNGDGIVDSIDLDLLQQMFLNSPGPDTDGDGIPDIDDPDDDNDGFTDISEIASGTDPLDNTSFAPDGDINMDGVVNVVDFMMGQQILTGLLTPMQQQLNHADVAPLVSGTPMPDGLFTLGDLVVIQRKVLGIVNF